MENGTALDFVLDTGATINTLESRLTDELHLKLVFSYKDLPLFGTAGMGGTIQSSNAGDIYLLGDCQLVGMPPGMQEFTFMTNLTAASLPHATPVGHGLLGLTFFQSFPAGVEFDWHGTTDGDPPTLIFYYGQELPREVQTNLTTRVGLKRMTTTSQILLLPIRVNGTELPAMLDTGAPVTVFSHQAAKQAGIETVLAGGENVTRQQQQQQQQQVLGDDVLTVRGVDGVLVELHRSVSPVSIQAGGDDDDDRDVTLLGKGPVYIGDLPGLALMSKLGGGGGGGDSSPQPSVVLGLDFLRQTYRMVLRVPANEVWFEEMHAQLSTTFQQEEG